MRYYRVRVGAGGTVVLPREVVDYMGLRAGREVSFMLTGRFAVRSTKRGENSELSPPTLHVCRTEDEVSWNEVVELTMTHPHADLDARGKPHRTGMTLEETERADVVKCLDCGSVLKDRHGPSSHGGIFGPCPLAR